MLSRDQRNYHAWAYRRYVVSHLESSRLDGQSMVESEFAYTTTMFSMVDGGLNVGPEDQSLWYYHQYLIFNVAEQPANLAIVPEMDVNDKVKLISRQVDFIKDLLEDYHDVKWIFEMLLEYTLLTYKLRNEPLGVEQSQELESWVTSIKRLDPQRFNRWQELAEKLKISD
ncbi:Rab geranylgeranyltransferase [Beauveria asiatica]|uniref:Geranylgeranyl transferase type-2 subunit alpha n=1 Tax=Beauveria asiatica TaxID=1069075 RepID=A0AAW0S6V5_9HYPO